MSDHKFHLRQLEENLSLLAEENDALKSKALQLDQLTDDLKSSELRFKNIFEGSSLGNKVINSDLKIIKVNNALTDMLGYSEQELLGMRIMDIAYPEHINVWKELQHELWTNKKDSFTIDSRIIKKDKTIIWCHVTSILFTNAGDTFGYTIIEDISQRKKFEQDLKDATEQHLAYQREQHTKTMKIIVTTQEEERKRMADSVHNSLGQLFYGVKLALDHINLDTPEPQEKNKGTLRKAKDLLSECIAESRRLSHELMPTVLEDFGLEGAVQDICYQLSGKVKFKCAFNGSSKRLEKHIEIAVYRIVQELMLNIVKHSEATFATVGIGINSSEIIIKVEDNGKGFTADEETDGKIGLQNVKSKLVLFKGKLDISSQPERGTVINISLPCI
jgi:PAS domain S-box-containing protein